MTSLLDRAMHALTRSARKARYKKLKARLGEIGDPKAVFSEIYADNLWNDAESRSGPGSTMAYTASIRAALPGLIARHNVRTFLDAPCGDFHWMRAVPLPETSYIGGDIVPALIADTQKRHGDARRRFEVIDITHGPLPKADLWMCRDCMFHLSYADIARALAQYAAADIPLLLLTTHLVTPPGAPISNRDIVTGDARPIDLFSEPFGFPAPIERFPDWIAPYAPREMVLFRREDVLPVAARMGAQFLAESR
jgi:hypothetical protein